MTSVMTPKLPRQILATSDPETLAAEILRSLKYRVGKDATVAKSHDWLVASIKVVRDRIIDQWIKSTKEAYDAKEKRVYYLSLEFLIGRLMRDAFSNLGLLDGHARRFEVARRGIGRHRRARAGCRAWQWRSRPSRCLFHGVDGDRRRARAWLRHSLRKRHVPPGDLRRLAGRASRKLARPRQSVGVRAPRALLRGRLRRPCRIRHLQGRPSRAACLEAGRAHPGGRLRHAGGRLARQPREHAAAVVVDGDRSDPARRLQRRRPHRRAARQQQGGSAVARPLSGRLQPGRTGTAAAAGVFLLDGLAAGHRAAALQPVQRSAVAAGQGGDPSERHASGDRGRGTDAALHGRSRHRLRQGLGRHQADLRLHQPHAAARSAGKLAGAAVRAPAAAPHADHLRDQRGGAARGALDRPLH